MMQFLKNRPPIRAFTLIEVILVVVVIAVLVVIGAESFKKSREQLAFENTVNRVVELMQKARTLAINSALYKGYTGAGETDWKEVVPSGYGVRITRPHSDGTANEQTKGYGGKIELFVDNRYTGQAGCDDLEILYTYSVAPTPCFTDSDADKKPDNADEPLETYDIPSDIAVQLNAIYGITIIFSPPFADVKMYQDFNTTETDFTFDGWTEGGGTIGISDKNTATFRLINRLNPNTNQIIAFNRFGGVPELAKE